MRPDLSIESEAPMRYTSLAVVSSRVTVGAPLPFNVYNDDHTLLLARGRRLDSDAQWQALLQRGTLVDLAELHRGADAVRHAPAALLPAMWTDGMDRVARALRQTNAETFREALDEAIEPVAALIDRDPDLAIFQVLRQDASAHVQYGANHAVHTAIVTRLVALRLGWSEDDTTRAFKAALTMNVSMLDLQGRLAEQGRPPTEQQRAEIREHPQASRELLEMAGINDQLWLRAVEEHHEEPDGRGYPHGITDVCEMATLLHRADVYSAKLSVRGGREAMAADRAGREIFMSDPSSPINAALVKELGVYPPGCFVSLASGETGIVVKRGPTVMAPVVAAMTNRYGEVHPEPVRRDTSQPMHAIVGVLAARSVKVRVAPEALATMSAV